MPVADQVVTSGGQGSDGGDQGVGRAGHAARDAHHEVDVHPAAVREPVRVEQPVQRGTWPRSNSSNSGTTSRSWRELVELADERPRVEEHVVAEVGGAHRQAARVRLARRAP